MTDTKGKVILLDDDKFLADMYSMKFTQSGYEVTACLSAQDAIAAIQKGFDPDAILFDLVMPGTDGFAFLESLKSGRLAERAVKIALTNQSDDGEREKAMHAGADRYIVKASMIPSEVVSAVGEEIAKKKGK
ncbi:MAG TPA: response regulator [Candidatus Paceibacterota bacterium]|jgi:two-component system KDP operon response regulator KdpE|nr:response regulator [Candidatus Paceibacterota bacterium]